MFPNGAVFHKAQGRWQYLNYDATYSFLTKKLETDTATSILRMALDLSYERRGALLCVVNETESLQKMIPDYASKGRANIALRKSLKGLNVNDSDQRHVIKAAATADGALVIDREGEILDVACMIGDPSDLDLTNAGQTQLRRMSGARSTAAWNASIYGLAIKVSEDGPITVFENGSLTSQIG
jgi:DNA integrity scanning protein DisA with diadenylate cyclase activity